VRATTSSVANPPATGEADATGDADGLALADGEPSPDAVGETDGEVAGVPSVPSPRKTTRQQR